MSHRAYERATMSKLIYLVLLFFVFEGKVYSESVWGLDSLYSSNDTGIQTSNVTNFQDILFNNDKVTVYQFYNSWCGHCRRYAPFFKEFGKLVNNWHPVVQVAAINCADEANVEICRNYSVIAYPTVRLFWTHVNNQSDTGEPVENLEFSAEFLRDAVVKFISNNLKTKSPPARWPDLSKTKLTAPHELNNQLVKTKLNSKTHPLPVVALVEKNDSYVGQQIILELSNYRDKIEVLSLNIPVENQLNFTTDTSNKTALLQFEPNSNATYRILASLPLTEKNQTAYYVNYIDQNIFDSKLRVDEHVRTPTIEQTQKPNSTSNDTSQRANVQPQDLPLQMNDLYGAISYTIHQQITLKKTINGDELNILKRLFDIIERYFPADDPKFAEFIKNLNQFVKSKEQELEINDYLNHLKKNNFDFKSKFQGWQTCKGSTPKYRGYTCSLWSLFHTLTVNEYLKEKDAQKWVNLHEVLFTMRDYIDKFFSCSDCAHHFVGMAMNLENELKFPNSSVLWLWQAHNRVNKRLKGDLTEDPEHPKGSYPYQKNCTQCYLPNGEFNQDEVMKYLINRYGHVKKQEQPKVVDSLLKVLEDQPKVLEDQPKVLEDQPKALEDQPKVLEDKPKVLEDKPKALEDQPQSDKLTFESDPDSFKNNKVFNYTDYSLIFGLYILITTIVMSVFFYLPIRIRRKAKSTKSNGRYLDV